MRAWQSCAQGPGQHGNDALELRKGSHDKSDRNPVSTSSFSETLDLERGACKQNTGHVNCQRSKNRRCAAAPENAYIVRVLEKEESFTQYIAIAILRKY